MKDKTTNRWSFIGSAKEEIEKSAKEADVAVTATSSTTSTIVADEAESMQLDQGDNMAEAEPTLDGLFSRMGPN